MPKFHVVSVGEHLPGIAARYGFRDWRTVWEGPDNADLRDLRTEPAALLPDDVVAIPDPEPRSVDCATAQRHTFRMRRAPVRLRLRLEDPFGNALANTPCVLTVDGAAEELTSDGDGMIEHDVSAEVRSAALEVEGFEFELSVGGLDPSASPTGLQGRLANLGHFVGLVGDEDEDGLRFAVELFQAEQGLSVTGVADDIAGPLEEHYGV